MYFDKRLYVFIFIVVRINTNCLTNECHNLFLSETGAAFVLLGMKKWFNYCLFYGVWFIWHYMLTTTINLAHLKHWYIKSYMYENKLKMKWRILLTFLRYSFGCLPLVTVVLAAISISVIDWFSVSSLEISEGHPTSDQS